MKEEITSEIKNLLVESQREMLKLLKPETRENIRDNTEEEIEEETRNFYFPAKSVRISSTQNDPSIGRNRCYEKMADKKQRMPAIHQQTPRAHQSSIYLMRSRKKTI